MKVIERLIMTKRDIYKGPSITGHVQYLQQKLLCILITVSHDVLGWHLHLRPTARLDLLPFDGWCLSAIFIRQKIFGVYLLINAWF